jgi:hypothetical protein
LAWTFTANSVGFVSPNSRPRSTGFSICSRNAARQARLNRTCRSVQPRPQSPLRKSAGSDFGRCASPCSERPIPARARKGKFDPLAALGSARPPRPLPARSCRSGRPLSGAEVASRRNDRFRVRSCRWPRPLWGSKPTSPGTGRNRLIAAGRGVRSRAPRQLHGAMIADVGRHGQPLRGGSRRRAARPERPAAAHRTVPRRGVAHAPDQRTAWTCLAFGGADSLPSAVQTSRTALTRTVGARAANEDAGRRLVREPLGERGAASDEGGRVALSGGFAA